MCVKDVQYNDSGTSMNGRYLANRNNQLMGPSCDDHMRSTSMPNVTRYSYALLDMSELSWGSSVTLTSTVKPATADDCVRCAWDSSV